MEYVKLGDYCTITSSKRIFAHQYVANGIPFYRSKEIIEKNNNENVSSPLFISVDVYNEIKQKYGVPSSGDILLTSVGTLGVPYLVKDETFYFKDGNLTWLKNFDNRISSNYIYYWLSSSFGKASLLQRAIGSSQPALTIEILKKYKLFLPKISEQRRIASILSAYDNLIENNNRRIRLLEQMAENLYKEWFVRFRFPGHEKAEFENGLPKGWQIAKLGNFIIFERGVGYGAKDIQDGENVLLSMNNLRPYGGFIRDYSRPYNGKYKDFQKVKKGDLIMSITDMTQDRRIIGYTGIVPPGNDNRIICTHLMKLTSKESHSYFLDGLFNYSNLSRVIAERATGANVLGLTADILKGVKTLLPPTCLQTKYVNKVTPIIESIFRLQESNDNLSRQRDLLLPRLMSGKLEVKV